eukprot:CAMPEP_0194437008 /NCGR_PEP_ID=MMETSP0176-20130528/97658_1 /TAXON_ID=216777 /ORGANISM="Proboscia alata, Strain PI-D3" /LENGTH=173 /DNA_ID=CAMNT_0039257887 /DNA_START=53 /DNA_END=570 /DNA_ORIENTATION=+
MSLDLEDIRSAARHCGLQEIYFKKASAVISFAPPTNSNKFRRINVYYTTGTVGTCIDHPSQGATQLFRRGVGIDLLKQLMLEPRTHTGDGYHRNISRQDTENEHGPNPSDEETELLTERDRLRVEAATVSAKLNEVDAALVDYARRREEKEREEMQRIRRGELRREAYINEIT